LNHRVVFTPGGWSAQHVPFMSSCSVFRLKWNRRKNG